MTVDISQSSLAQAFMAANQAQQALAKMQQLTSAGLLAWAYAQAFAATEAVRDANGAIVTASIVWPDGSTGEFTTDIASAAFPGAIDAWHATYINGSTVKTVTQAAVTRDANGAVTAQPAITIT
jgi:hypothetical protein